MEDLRYLMDIARVTSGYSFRRAVTADDDDDGIGVIHARNIDGLYIDSSSLKKTSQVIPPQRLFKRGDVVLSSRGHFRAGVFKSNDKAVGSLSVFTIRIVAENILPEYLAVYLNTTQAQAYLLQNAMGATMQSIRLSDLRMLKVPVISLREQKLVTDLSMNVEKQSSLLQDKQKLVSEIFTGAINKKLEGVY